MNATAYVASWFALYNSPEGQAFAVLLPILLTAAGLRLLLMVIAVFGRR